jgi:hypothetical protein
VGEERDDGEMMEAARGSQTRAKGCDRGRRLKSYLHGMQCPR